jgi:hypothetical protein
MSTRLYLNADAFENAAAFPAGDTGYWSSAGSMNRYGCSTTRGKFPATTKAFSESSSSRLSPCILQFVCAPLAAQTISGTVKGQIRVMESAAAADNHLLLHMRVVGGDGTSRGTLFSSSAVAGTTVSAVAGTDTYELDTVATNRKLPPGWSGAGASLSSVTAQDFDRLVIEIGIRHTNTTNTTFTTTFNVGSDSASTDLPEDETTTADNWPWIELSHDLLMQDSVFDFASTEFEYTGGGILVPTQGQIWPRGNRGV